MKKSSLSRLLLWYKYRVESNIRKTFNPVSFCAYDIDQYDVSVRIHKINIGRNRKYFM